METEMQYFVKVKSYSYTTCGGSGTNVWNEYFDTFEEALKFIADMKDKEKFEEYSRKEMGHDGFIKEIYDTIYKKTVTIELIK